MFNGCDIPYVRCQKECVKLSGRKEVSFETLSKFGRHQSLQVTPFSQLSLFHLRHIRINNTASSTLATSYRRLTIAARCCKSRVNADPLTRDYNPGWSMKESSQFSYNALQY